MMSRLVCTRFHVLRIALVLLVTLPAAGAVPTLNLTSPNGGEEWQAGSTQTVTWTSTDPVGNISILLCQQIDGVNQNWTYLVLRHYSIEG